MDPQPNQELVAFIKQRQERGDNLIEIADELKGAGWDQKDIDKAIGSFGVVPIIEKVPESAPQFVEPEPQEKTEVIKPTKKIIPTRLGSLILLLVAVIVGSGVWWYSFSYEVPEVVVTQIQKKTTVATMDIVATVDGSPISRFAFVQELEKKSGSEVLDSLITEKLIENEAVKQGITVTQDEVDLELKSIEDKLKTQRKTLDEALLEQKITLGDLIRQLTLRKKLEKLLGDKITITETDVAQYIKSNKITIPKGKEADYNDQIKAELQQQEFQTVSQDFITSLKTMAKIEYFVNY